MEITQHVVVSREGAVKTDPDEFSVDLLGTPLTVKMQYSLHEGEKHGSHGHGRIQLTDDPIVFGAAVIRANYNPFADVSTFEIETNEFQSRYILSVRQTLKVWLHNTSLVVAESKIVIQGPERQPGKLDAMPTTIVDWRHAAATSFDGPPLIFAPDKPKQRFQLLVDPFGGQSITKTARVEIRYADSRELGKLLIVPHVAGLADSGRILDDGTGAVFVVTGLKPKRNYTLVLDVDGDKKYTWQATTKTGPYYDVIRAKAAGEL